MLKLLDAAVVLKKWTIVNKIVTKRMEKNRRCSEKKLDGISTLVQMIDILIEIAQMKCY